MGCHYLCCREAPGKKRQDHGEHSKSPRVRVALKTTACGILKVLVVITAASNFAKFKSGHLTCIISLALPSLPVR